MSNRLYKTEKIVEL